MRSKKKVAVILYISLVLCAISCFGSENSEYRFGEMTELAYKYHTDKGEGHHYAEIYEYFFYPIKYSAKKIFEIGIGKGASLKMWRDYFPEAVIYGIDIHATWFTLDSDRIKTFIADQANRRQLQNFINTHGNDFDVIVDDGGHSMHQQQISLGYLFKYLKPGGYYVIEDVNASIFAIYKQRFGALPSGDNTTLAMVDKFVRTGIIESDYMTAEEKRYLTDNIVYCNMFARNRGHSIMCIFKKRSEESTAR